MTDRIDPKVIADEARDYAGADEYSGAQLLRECAATIDALIEERDRLLRNRAFWVGDAMEYAAVVEKVRGVIGSEIGWESPAMLIDRIQWALSTAPADALAEHDAALMDSLASEFERAGQYIGLSFAIIRLRERARLILEGDKK